MFRSILDTFFIFMLFEGSLRRYILPSLSVEIQIFRDLLPSLALFIFIHTNTYRNAHIWPKRAVSFFLIIYVTVCFLQLFNFALWSPVVGLLGLRTHLAYLPLLLLAPYYISTTEDFYLRIRSACFLIVPIVALGFLQSRLPASHFLNAGADIAYSYGNSIRASGTFSYITGYSVLCQFVFVCSLALILIRPLLSFDGLVSLMGGASSFIGCLTSGSRSAVFGALLQFIFMIFVFSIYRGRSKFGINRILIFVVFGFALIFFYFQDIYYTFDARVQGAGDDIFERVGNSFFGWARVLIEFPLGNGIGMAHQQAGTLVGYGSGFHSGYESELERVAFELGVLGFASFFAFRLAVVFRIWRRCRVTRNAQVLAPLVVALSTLIILLPGGLFTPISNSLVFLLSGVGIASFARPIIASGFPSTRPMIPGRLGNVDGS